MRTLFKKIRPLHILLFSMLCSGCSDDSSREENIKQEYAAWSYINKFAHDAMSKYYLWNDEIAKDLDAWNLEWSNPTQKVQTIRYKKNGEEVDRWTRVITDYEAETSDVAETYGFDYLLYRPSSYKEMVAVVTVVYTGSPAEKAGLKRGDIILALNDKAITSDNYQSLQTSSSAKLVIQRNNVQKEVKMNATTMYEDPVLLDSIYKVDNRKVGYLVYTRFEVSSCDKLISVCKRFKKEGVKEMILDLRYNLGGTNVVHQLLASMLAPEADVKAGGLYLQRIHNDEHTKELLEAGDEMDQHLQTQLEWNMNGKDYAYDISDANVGLTKLYVLVSGNTASASEALLVGLSPYVEMELIGEQTRGKYCGGYNLSASEWFQEQVDEYQKEGRDFYAEHPEWADWKNYTSNWGLYVITSTFTDKNGTSLELGKGLMPVLEAIDTPFERYPLGDDRETMLRAALARIGNTDVASKAVEASNEILKTYRPVQEESYRANEILK